VILAVVVRGFMDREADYSCMETVFSDWDAVVVDIVVDLEGVGATWLDLWKGGYARIKFLEVGERKEHDRA
jgi:hypothetical protein